MAQAKSKSSVKVKVQKFGTALSGMIMPNIGAIIAWGLTAAFFMYPHGWFPNKEINNLVQPMLHYLLPLLIGYTGGRMVYEERGAVAGAIGTLGVIVGTDQPMFLGAMIMGPLSAWLLKKLDQVFQDKIKSGFEMIYNNFSLGILGMIAAIFAFFIIGPIMEVGSQWASAGVNAIIRVHLLPLANIIIEPAKVLFLNNAIGNGILVPLGIQQAAQVGKSVLFLMESNPGPGLGIRVIGEVTPDKVKILQEADDIFITELMEKGLYNKVDQAFVTLLPVKTVGVMGDQRTYEFVAAIRSVNTIDFMTATWSKLPYEFLEEVSNKIINRVNGINRIVYDISSKPPGTIEWE